ncbi:toxin-antitoxin system HicB family antitoxin [Actinosynnema sp. NPDC059335]|uniref:toxin-antitoxin system HicB family antitoxin n=1 Tax=Actinosynnema sp. NPDC059335 TaxID=3346804 RepID=UPI00366F3223
MAPLWRPDEGPVARINLRLPEPLKLRVEEAASREGVSVNAWLVRTAAAGLGRRGRTSTGAVAPGRHFTGWVR